MIRHRNLYVYIKMHASLNRYHVMDFICTVLSRVQKYQRQWLQLLIAFPVGFLFCIMRLSRPSRLNVQQRKVDIYCKYSGFFLGSINKWNIINTIIGSILISTLCLIFICRLWPRRYVTLMKIQYNIYYLCSYIYKYYY